MAIYDQTQLQGMLAGASTLCTLTGDRGGGMIDQIAPAAAPAPAPDMGWQAMLGGPAAPGGNGPG